MITPALVVLGAVATWQFGPSQTSPAEAGSAPPSSRAAQPSVRAADQAQLFVTRAALQVIENTTPRQKSRPRPAKAVAAGKQSARRVAHQPRPSPSPSAKAACAGTAASGMLPANYGAIVTFLVGHGYTPIAATGIAGNIYQESKGNPESVGTGGGGLIGWTPLPAGFVTGNPTADLQTQLTALLGYNQQWAQYIPALNAATDPTQAADIYMDDFERPGLPVAYNREGAANAVAQACGIK